MKISIAVLHVKIFAKTWPRLHANVALNNAPSLTGNAKCEKDKHKGRNLSAKTKTILLTVSGDGTSNTKYSHNEHIGTFHRDLEDLIGCNNCLCYNIRQSNGI